MHRITIALLILSAIASFQCTSNQGSYPGPPGYNMDKAYRLKLPLELDEISGLAYYARDTSVFAINDERGLLYKLGLGTNRNITRWKFSPGEDFEDLVLLDSSFYVLQSDGTLIKIVFQAGQAVPEIIPFQYGKDNEFEILYYDDQKKKLILICKDCESDKKKSLTTFSFDPVTRKFSDSSFSINVDLIAASINEKKIRFKPSAAAINPVDSLLYIVSAINKLLVVTDRDGNFKKAYPINSSLFKQPEGLTFTPSGSMIFSNEAADVGVADILIFSFGKTGS